MPTAKKVELKKFDKVPIGFATYELAHTAAEVFLNARRIEIAERHPRMATGYRADLNELKTAVVELEKAWNRMKQYHDLLITSLIDRPECLELLVGRLPLHADPLQSGTVDFERLADQIETRFWHAKAGFNHLGLGHEMMSISKTADLLLDGSIPVDGTELYEDYLGMRKPIAGQKQFPARDSFTECVLRAFWKFQGKRPTYSVNYGDSECVSVQCVQAIYELSKPIIGEWIKGGTLFLDDFDSFNTAQSVDVVVKKLRNEEKASSA